MTAGTGQGRGRSRQSVAFFIYGPKAIGNGVDQTFAILLDLGLIFAWGTRHRTNPTFVFGGNDAIAITDLATPVPRQRRDWKNMISI